MGEKRIWIETMFWEPPLEISQEKVLERRNAAEREGRKKRNIDREERNNREK